jgi:phosphate uptake regulator
MKRKIVQHGSSSLTITLPSQWVQRFGLKKGNELNIEECGSSVIVSTEKSQTISKKDISADQLGIFRKNDLAHLYQLGYDEVEISFEDKDTLDSIKKSISNCIGFEIIDMKPNKVYIKCIATALETEFDTLLRKSFQIVNEMSREIIDALQEGDNSKFEEIRVMENLCDKFTDTCLRILNKKGYSNPKKNMQMYEIVKNIERIGDEMKFLCDYLKDLKKPGKKVIEIIEEVFDYYLTYYGLFYKFEPKLEQKMYTQRKVLINKLLDELKNSKGNYSLVLYCLLNITQKSYEGCGAYLCLIL